MTKKKRKDRGKVHASQSMRSRDSSQSTLSLCMIVKNEAHNLIHCIETVRSAVDEIIVVDTGSRDNTRELAAGAGAKVFKFPWCDDFSAARNESIRHATGDYILWLDADDRMDSPEVEKIKALKRLFPEKKDQAYYLIVNNQSPVDGETLFYQMRIFPNVEGVGFEGRIHEQIFQAFTKRGTQLIKTEITIRHMGYRSAEVMQGKSERNLKIVEKELESDPDNLILQYNAARTLSGLKRPAEAIQHIKRITDEKDLRIKSPQFYLEASLLLGKYQADSGCVEDSISLYRDLANEFENHGLITFCLGQALFLSGRYQEASEALEKSIALPIEVGLLPLNLNMLRFYQYYTLGECYVEGGEEQRAGEMFLRSLQFPSDHHRSYQTLGHLALKAQRFEEAARYYEKSIEKGKGSDTTYANLGLAYRKLERWQEAEQAFKKGLELNPQRIEALSNLGHLYHLRKEYALATVCFTQALELAPDLADVRLVLSDIYFRGYELEKLVMECDALRKYLGLPCDMTLNDFEELSGLYEEMSAALQRSGRADLALLAYRVSFLIHPTNRALEKLIRMADLLKVLKSYLADIEDILRFHKGGNQEINSRNEVLSRP